VRELIVYRIDVVFGRLLAATGTVEPCGSSTRRGGFRNLIRPRSLPKARSFSVEPLRGLL
jgi:hypothetical protein